jgi:conjugal transfer/entry exclusion protein
LLKLKQHFAATPVNVQKPLLKAGMTVIKKTKGAKNAAAESKMYAPIPTAMADIWKCAADVKNAHAEIKKVLKKTKRVEEKTEANHAHGEFLLRSAIAKLRKADELLAGTERKNAHANHQLTCASAKLCEADRLLADAQRAAAELKKADAHAPKSSQEDWWWFDGSWWIGCTGSDCNWCHKGVF